jgi:hypothetical protein
LVGVLQSLSVFILKPSTEELSVLRTRGAGFALLKTIVYGMHWPEEECAMTLYSRGKGSDTTRAEKHPRLESKKQRELDIHFALGRSGRT